MADLEGNLNATKRRIDDLLDFKDPEATRPWRKKRRLRLQAAEKELSFRPGDRASLLDRLQTFGVPNWPRGAYSEGMNEVAWARLGWTCTGKNYLQCKACNKGVMVVMEPRSEGARKVLEGKYTSLTVEAHDERCRWRRFPTEKRVYRLPIGRNEIKEAFEARRNLLQTCDLSSLVLATPNTTLREMDSASALALLGWSKESPTVLKCQDCFRKLGLWSFTKKENQKKLNVVSQHFPYCPWVCPETQTGDDNGDPGWQIAYRNIYPPSRPASVITPINTLEESDAVADALSVRLRKLRQSLFGR